MKKTVVSITIGCLMSLLLLNLAYADSWTGYHQVSALDVQDTFSVVWFEGLPDCPSYRLLTRDDNNYREKLTLLMGAFFGRFEVDVKYLEHPVTDPDCPMEHWIYKVRVRE